MPHIFLKNSLSPERRHFKAEFCIVLVELFKHTDFFKVLVSINILFIIYTEAVKQVNQILQFQNIIDQDCLKVLRREKTGKWQPQ